MILLFFLETYLSVQGKFSRFLEHGNLEQCNIIISLVFSLGLQREFSVGSCTETACRVSHTPLPHCCNYSQLINRANRLLLIHGMNDENVFFKHTSQLVDCLVGMAKPYQLQVNCLYPSVITSVVEC